jgi:GNAT superfamily N-acetyltransferase
MQKQTVNISISKTRHFEDIALVAKLADEIWWQHFNPIIGANQVEYMLKKFQSPEAISAQITMGTEYYLAWNDEKAVGYTGLISDQANSKMMISKLYVKQESRFSGIGTKLLRFIQQECGTRDLDILWLTVNRFNLETIKWYQRKGFDIVDEVKKDIGGGFFMDDFLMEMKL